MRGFGERGVGGGFVAVAPVVADVVRHFVVDGGLAWVGGVRGIDHGGQHVVIDVDQFGGVFRGLDRIGDHERDLIADVAHFRVRDDRMRRLVHRLAVGAVDQPAARQAADVFGGHVRAGEDRDHAGRLLRRGDVDAVDFRVRVGRAQEDGVGLLRQDDVVGVLAVAGQEPIVFLTFDGGADRGGCRVRSSSAPQAVAGAAAGALRCVRSGVVAALPEDFMPSAPSRTALTML